jgi:CBS domain-containing protein
MIRDPCSRLAPVTAGPDPLSSPIGALAASIEPAQTGDSLRAAARDMAAHGLPVQPVAEGHITVGSLDGAAISEALAAGADPDSPVCPWVRQDCPVLPPYATGAEALRLFQATGAPAIVVVDDAGEAVGVLTPARLIHAERDRSLFGKVGGMATPFGVYLTNGAVAGGVGSLALVATGAFLFGLFLIAGTAMSAVTVSVPRAWSGAQWWPWVYENGTLALFLLGLRLSPLAGVHAAEHMVVHALERGEALKPDVVRRMPRLHPRCGTNLAVGATLFLGVMNQAWLGAQDVRLLVALVATLFLWRPLGMTVQHLVTTKPANDAQIRLGIRAGEDLLDKMDRAPIAHGTLLNRLLMSGLVQIMVGSFLVQGLAWLVWEAFRVPAAWRVF